MIKYRVMLATIVHLLLLQCCIVQSTTFYIPENSTATYISGFCLDILKEEALLNSNNIVAAPVSIHLVLLLLLFGATGRTHDQILHVVANDTGVNEYQYELTRNIKARADLSTDLSVTLETDNEMFVSHAKTIERDFRNFWAPRYSFQVSELDFSKRKLAADFINARINQSTHGRISKIISQDDVSDLTALVLTSATYFKGEWKTQFPTKYTALESFHLSRHKSIQVPMMRIKDKFRTGYCPVMEAKWLELPFKDERYSMYVVLPTQFNGMNNLLARMTGEHIHKMSLMENNLVTIQVTLPKFNISHEADLADTLQGFGLGELFTTAANFEGISRDIYISKFIQKAEVSVDEFGATASAAQVTTMLTKSSGGLEFVVDRPFLMFIVDRLYKVPFFVARVTNPAK